MKIILIVVNLNKTLTPKKHSKINVDTLTCITKELLKLSQYSSSVRS